MSATLNANRRTETPVEDQEHHPRWRKYKRHPSAAKEQCQHTIEMTDELCRQNKERYEPQKTTNSERWKKKTSGINTVVENTTNCDSKKTKPAEKVNVAGGRTQAAHIRRTTI